MKSTALLILSLAAGLGLGWNLRSGEGATLSFTGAVKNSSTTSPVVHDRPGRPQTSTSGPARTLATVEKWLIPKDGLPAEARAAIAAMSPENLQTLMVQIAKEKRLPDHTAGRAWQDGLLNAAAEELCRRDLPRSLDWGLTFRAVRSANSIPGFKSVGTDCLLPQLVQAASKLDAAATIDWMRQNGPQDWSETHPGNIAYNAAVAHGAEAMLKAESDSTGEVTLDEGFPEGFDFARLIAGSKKQVITPIVAGYWAGIDPDAAWECVREKSVENPHLPGVLLEGVAMTRGNGEAAAWLAQKLNDLPAEQRLNALRHIESSSPAAVEAIMSRLDGEQERLAYVRSTLEQGGSPLDPHRPDVRALELLGGEDLQVQVITDYVQGGGRTDIIQRKLNLPPEVWQKIKAAAPVVPGG